VESQEVNTLLAVFADDPEEKIGINITGITRPPDCFVYWNSPNRGIKRKDFFPDCDKIPPGGQIHESVGTIAECRLGLFLFKVRITAGAGGPDININFYLTARTYRALLVHPLWICRNHNPSC
jgi:uncharacterized membrane protein YqaE (UPF0057 family)